MRATSALAAAGVASPEHDARALAVHLLGLRRLSDLLTVEDIDESAYGELVGRRAARLPLQHLVGSVGFRYLDLLVGPGVFVPRPETELVAGAAIDRLRLSATASGAAMGIPNPLSGVGNVQWGSPIAPAFVLVDLCTGSGAIALSVAKEVPGARVHAVELDPVALSWARRNAEALELGVAFTEGPLEGCLSELDGTVDVVVSNPPYVPVGTQIDVETGHDPALALWGGEDGLEVIAEVQQAARRLLKPGGVVVVEHDVTHGHAAPALFAAAGGWVEIVDHHDLTGRPRYVTARWLP